MKKILACVLVFALITALLSGCGNNNSKDSAPKGSEEVKVSPSPERGYEKGILTETDFESSYLNLRFTVPEGFIMATQEDINNMMNLGADVMGLDEKLIDYANMVSVYEMMVSAPSGSPSVIVMVEKLALSNITIEQYFDALKTQLSNLTEINYVINDDITSVEIAGQSYKQLIVTTNVYGQNLTQSYMLRKSGDRMVGFITTSTPDTEETLAILMNSFVEY